MNTVRNRYNEVLTRAYLNTLQLEETKRKFSRTTTTFRGRKAMEFIYNASADGKGCRTQRDVADFLRITRPSCTTLINKLEALGYVYREKNGDDERSTDIYLTRKGRLVTVFQCDHRNDMIDQIVSEFPQEEQEILYRGFARLNEVLEHCIEMLETSGKEWSK